MSALQVSGSHLPGFRKHMGFPLFLLGPLGLRPCVWQLWKGHKDVTTLLARHSVQLGAERNRSIKEEEGGPEGGGRWGRSQRGAEHRAGAPSILRAPPPGHSTVGEATGGAAAYAVYKAPGTGQRLSLSALSRAAESTGSGLLPSVGTRR